MNTTAMAMLVDARRMRPPGKRWCQRSAKMPPRIGPASPKIVTAHHEGRLVLLDVVGTHEHPRATARSLAELTDEMWATTGITTKAESELTQLFARHNLLPPRTTIQADSMLSLTTLLSSDALAVTLPQYSESPLTRDAL